MKVSNSKIIINSDETEIIKLIKSPNNLEKFHPFCKKIKLRFGTKKNQLISLNIITTKFTNVSL